MADIPDNPTWNDIRLGMEAARDVALAAKTAVTDASAVISAQEVIRRAAQHDQRMAMDEIRDWEVAIRRKLMRGL